MEESWWLRELELDVDSARLSGTLKTERKNVSPTRKAESGP